nr:hypothetical protein [Bacteroidota bacterium]
MQGCKILVALCLLSLGGKAQCDSLTQYRKWQHLPYANFINNYLDSMPQPVAREIFVDGNGYTRLRPRDSQLFVPTLIDYTKPHPTNTLAGQNLIQYSISERDIDSLYFVKNPKDTILFKPCLH